MSRLYLYGIVRRAPAAALGSGLRGEPLTVVRAADLIAVVGEMDEPPAATAESVVGHDAVVRRLAEATDAVLPARFGNVQERDALTDWLAGAASALGDALRLVAGREQMTLHVFDAGEPVTSETAPTSVVADDDASRGPGARYLAARRRHWQLAGALDEIAPLRPRLDGLVVAERVERRATPPFRASVYHLIERGRSGAYRQAVDPRRELATGVRLRVSGPWAPYAFAPALAV